MGRLAWSKALERVSALVILLNAVFNIITANAEMDEPANDLPSAFFAIEIAFLIFYTIELSSKLTVYRGSFFMCEDSRWNVLDFILVVIAMLDMVATLIFKGRDAGINVTFLRSLRALRLTKILRIARIMRYFKELRMVLDSLVRSVAYLFWSFIVVVFFYFMFSIAFVQSTSSYLGDNVGSLDDESERSLHERFGSVQEGLLTLFMESTGGDDWTNVYGVVEKTGAISSALWIFFVAFVQIALLNILTSMFVEQATKIAQPDYAALDLERRQQEERELTELDRLCADMDTDRSGSISLMEFQRCLESGKLKCSLSVLGLDIQDAKEFFRMLLKGESDDQVPIETFVAGCMRLKGGATSLHLQRMEHEMLSMERTHDAIVDCLSELLDGNVAPRQGDSDDDWTVSSETDSSTAVL